MTIEPISADTALFCAAHHFPADHRELTRLSPTTDASRFFRRDPIASACSAGAMPTQGFRPASKSVKDCRLTVNARIEIRSASRVGITGGDVIGAESGPIDASWAPVKAPKVGTGKNARKRARRARKSQ